MLCASAGLSAAIGSQRQPATQSAIYCSPSQRAWLSVNVMTAAMTAAPPPGDTGKRPVCSRCRRPERVCYCPALPKEALKLRGRVVILQHPFESKRRTATAPLLAHCLDNVDIVRGRKYKPGDALARRLEEAASGEYPLYVLFPGPGAADLASLVACQQQQRQQVQVERVHLEEEEEQQQQLQQEGEDHRPAVVREPARTSPPSTATAASAAAASGGRPLMAGAAADCSRKAPLPGAEAGGVCRHEPAGSPSAAAAAAAEAASVQQLSGGGKCQWALVALDGTWQQAREMFNALESRLVGPEGPGIRVQLALTPSRQQQLDQLQQQQEERQLIRRQERRRQRQAQRQLRKAQQAQSSDQYCDPIPAGTMCSTVSKDAAGSMPATSKAASRESGACAAADRAAVQVLQQVAAPAAAAVEDFADSTSTTAVQKEAVSAAGALLHEEGILAATPEAGLSEDEACLLMMEPLPGCVTTCEAVARAVSMLEGDGGKIKEAVMQPLLYVARLQAQWDPAVRARLSGVGAQYSTSRRHFGMGKSLGLRQ